MNLIKILNLSVRSQNALHRANLKYIEEIDLDKLLNIWGLGKKSIKEIKEAVLSFKANEDEFKIEFIAKNYAYSNASRGYISEITKAFIAGANYQKNRETK